MASANPRAIFPPTQKRRVSAGAGFSGLVKNSFTLPTLLLLGGLGQGLLSLILPPRYALLPLLFLLLRAAVLTAVDLSLGANHYLKKLGVIPGRTSAQLPAAKTYNPLASPSSKETPPPPTPFGTKPSETPTVVFHLGIRFNHPLGPLCPSGSEVGAHFQASHSDLLQHAREHGCLGATTWHGGDAARNNTLLYIYYFRDAAGLHRFAHSPVHRRAWDWFNKTVLGERKHGHIGIFHEVFCAPAGGYESIYINMPPELMGAGYAGVENEATERRSGCGLWWMRPGRCGGVRCRGWGGGRRRVRWLGRGDTTSEAPLVPKVSEVGTVGSHMR
ncbi:hypothetical protein N658DRAFT_478426 [Parathielavia hyrcaniae]|uniref:Monooxygenase n=1 Tax=Parathielavia hyrcaniae TaxID=113614 RepID=A0AAN6PYK0_9PEZI|nr:hypothetical protein N658DRAFT_478426 [Parathielavia hyrcaniae]